MKFLVRRRLHAWDFTIALTLAFIVSSGSLLCADETKNRASLTEGGLRSSSIATEKGETSVSFSLRILPDTYAVNLRIQSAPADLDMFVYDSDGALVWQEESTNWNEKIFVYRMGSPSLEDGNYTLSVRLAQGREPAVDNGSRPARSRIDFELATAFFSIKDFTPIGFSTVVRDKLLPENAMFKAYSLKVPVGIDRVRIDIFGSQTDTDIFAQVNRPVVDPRNVRYSSQTWRSRESLIIDIPTSGAEKMPQSTVYFVVLSEFDDAEADFSIVASRTDKIPPELTSLPDFAVATKPPSAAFLKKSLDASVELIAGNGGGTGCVIAPDGWILTNLHVLKNADGALETRVSVGFSRDFRQIPDSQFWADLVDTDPVHDLALLRIVSGFYDQAIPPGYRFPFMDLASSGSLRIGDPLFFSGYPTIGGLGNRATLTCTQGVVSGFQLRQGISYLKTAAAISPGNSGGAAIDGLGRCVGIPSMVVGAEASQIAYIIPVDAIPTAWLKKVGISF